MRRLLVLGVKNTQNRAAQRPRKKGPLARGRESSTPLASWEPLSFFWASSFFLAVPPPPLFVRSLLLYILLLRSSSSYTCQPSMSILECTSHQPFFLALCKLQWPPSPCPGITSTLMGSGCQLWVFNTKVTASPEVASPPCSYGQPIGIGISFAILEGIASGDVAHFSPVILACRGQGRSWQYNLAVQIPFIRSRPLLLPRHGPWALYGMGRSLQNFLAP